MLDLETFTFLSRSLEQSFAPIVILASNRGRVPIKTNTPSHSQPDTSMVSAHGIPPDLLSRLLIIPTHAYSPPEIRTIITLRARIEGLALSEKALDRVSGKGESVSLRYALQLLAPASVLARVAGRAGGTVTLGGVNAEPGSEGGATIEEGDVEECEGLFLDARRSARWLGEAGRENGTGSAGMFIS